MATMDLGKIRTLLVEDDRATRDLLVAILESVGIKQIDRASNGQEGFKRLSSFRPDLIVSDMMMEPMDGITFARSVRTHRDSPSQHTPIILLTAHTDRTTVIEARDAGVNAFVAKPVSVDEMRRKIVLVLNDPREFVESDDFVGPDRRRRELPLGSRHDRRKPS